MKIQLDTKNKTISLDQNIKLGEFTELLEELLPNGKWADYTLIPQTIVNWTQNPIIIERYLQPNQPYWQPWITYGGENTSEVNPNTINYDVTAGVFNLEVKN